MSISKLSTGRAVVLTLTVLIFASVFVGALAVAPASAQEASDEGNETVAEEPEIGEIEHDLSDDVNIVNVEWVGGEARVHLTAETRSTVVVTDSAAIDNLASNDGTGVRQEGYTVHDETIIVFKPASGDELITIGHGVGNLYASSGDRGLIDILSTAPTTQVLRWGVFAGGVGAILSLSLSVGMIKRRHENTYKELLAEERVRVEEDKVEGVLGKIQRFLERHKYALALAATLMGYLVAVRAGAAPSPAAAWDAANDTQRVLIAGSVAMTVVSFLPVYALATRLWEPSKEYVIDVDARDVLDPALGSNGGLAVNANPNDTDEIADELEDLDDMEVIAVYSGSPQRVTKMRIDGEAAEIRTPGGKGYIVEDFNPKRNTAIGTWPGTANDAEILTERSKIDGNREILRDESRMLRTLIGALPAIATASDTGAMRAVDAELRELTNVDADHVDGLLDRAAQGTRFEGFYSDDEDEEDGDDEDDESGLAALVDNVDPRDDDDDEGGS